MNSLYRRILQTSSRNRLLSPLSHFSTKTKPKPKPPNTANSDPPPRLWSPFSPKPKPNPEWARPTEIPFQAKVSNSVQLIGYVQAPVQFQTAADGSSWAATVLSHQLASDADSESPDSLPLWVPVIFEGDLAHIAVSHLKENDWVYIDGRLSASTPHVSGSQVQASVQVVAHDISFVEKDFKKKKSSNLFIQSETEASNHSDSSNIQVDLVSDPWKDLLDNPKEWQDYRAAKKSGLVSSKYPDFKRKDGTNTVLWLGRATKSLLSKLEGLEFDAQIQSSKEVTESKDSGDSAVGSWTDLVDNSTEWCDYRGSKLQGQVSSKFPDFKRKDGSSALWLNSAPRWILPKLEGLEFHVQIQKSKAVNDSGKVDELWKDLVENPDKWWDNRVNKINERAPDFKHKETGEVLWLNSSPTWVSLKLPPPKSKGDFTKKKRDTLLS